ncbi:hypothetical protein C8J57DRAFT_1223089 [Mycena rebaudengoi]|nr:hypothetical protein C8J57DRAFT_1223089 [Mycena rebaudengoi]
MGFGYTSSMDFSIAAEELTSASVSRQMQSRTAHRRSSFFVFDPGQAPVPQIQSFASARSLIAVPSAHPSSWIRTTSSNAKKVTRSDVAAAETQQKKVEQAKLWRIRKPMPMALQQHPADPDGLHQGSDDDGGSPSMLFAFSHDTICKPSPLASLRESATRSDICSRIARDLASVPLPEIRSISKPTYGSRRRQSSERKNASNVDGLNYSHREVANAKEDDSCLQSKNCSRLDSLTRTSAGVPSDRHSSRTASLKFETPRLQVPAKFGEEHDDSFRSISPYPTLNEIQHCRSEEMSERTRAAGKASKSGRSLLSVASGESRAKSARSVKRVLRTSPEDKSKGHDDTKHPPGWTQSPPKMTVQAVEQDRRADITLDGHRCRDTMANTVRRLRELRVGEDRDIAGELTIRDLQELEDRGLAERLAEQQQVLDRTRWNLALQEQKIAALEVQLQAERTKTKHCQSMVREHERQIARKSDKSPTVPTLQEKRRTSDVEIFPDRVRTACKTGRLSERELLQAGDSTGTTPQSVTARRTVRLARDTRGRDNQAAVDAPLKHELADHQMERYAEQQVESDAGHCVDVRLVQYSAKKESEATPAAFKDVVNYGLYKIPSVSERYSSALLTSHLHQPVDQSHAERAIVGASREAEGPADVHKMQAKKPIPVERRVPSVRNMQLICNLRMRDSREMAEAIIIQELIELDARRMAERTNEETVVPKQTWQERLTKSERVIPRAEYVLGDTMARTVNERCCSMTSVSAGESRAKRARSTKSVRTGAERVERKRHKSTKLAQANVNAHDSGRRANSPKAEETLELTFFKQAKREWRETAKPNGFSERASMSTICIPEELTSSDRVSSCESPVDVNDSAYKSELKCSGSKDVARAIDTDIGDKSSSMNPKSKKTEETPKQVFTTEKMCELRETAESHRFYERASTLMPLDLSIRYNDDAPGIPKSRSKAESIAPDEMRHCARINRAALRAGTEQSAQNASRPSPTAPGHHVSAVASSSAHPSSSLSSESASSELSNGSDDSPDFSTMFPAIINNIDNDYNLDFAPSTFWPQHEDHSLHTSIHAPITFGTTNESVHASIRGSQSSGFRTVLGSVLSTVLIIDLDQIFDRTDQNRLRILTDPF